MAGRGGRGRGRATLSFNIESLGFGRGEALPGALLQPPPLFPPLVFQPIPLTTNEEQDYLLALKQEFRGTMRDSPFYIKKLEKKRDIERYSDKYQQNGENTINWEPDWNFFPTELKIKTRRSTRTKATLKPILPSKRKFDETDVTVKLEELEKKEEAGDDAPEEDADDKKKEKGEDEDEEEELDEEDYDEEDMEEATDYIQSYFNNGEDYNEGSDDDLDDGPVY